MSKRGGEEEGGGAVRLGVLRYLLAPPFERCQRNRGSGDKCNDGPRKFLQAGGHAASINRFRQKQSSFSFPLHPQQFNNAVARLERMIFLPKVVNRGS